MNSTSDSKPIPVVEHHENTLTPIIPSEGIVIYEEPPFFVLCKPKLLPMKSLTIEKLEKLQEASNEKAKRQIEEEHSKLKETQL
jgi:BBSome-interacting protein 1